MQKSKKWKSLADAEGLGQCCLDDNFCTGSRLLLISYLTPLTLYSPSYMYICVCMYVYMHLYFPSEGV